MNKGRLEAFSDGLFAVAITIMLLEIKVPHGDTVEALHHALPLFIGYLISFIFVGIFWSNHHHLLHATKHISGGIMWANAHLLFWVTLLPVASGWASDNPYSSTPSACYGLVLFLAGIAWLILQHQLIKRNGTNSLLARAIGQDIKGKISAVLNFTGMILSYLRPWLGQLTYVLVAIIWLYPDRRIEKEIEKT